MLAVGGWGGGGATSSSAELCSSAGPSARLAPPAPPRPSVARGVAFLSCPFFYLVFFRARLGLVPPKPSFRRHPLLMVSLLASRTSALPDGFGLCLCFSRLRRMGMSLSAAWCRGVLPQMATECALSVESAAAPAIAPSPGSCFASITDALVQRHAHGHPCQAWTVPLSANLMSRPLRLFALRCPRIRTHSPCADACMRHATHPGSLAFLQEGIRRQASSRPACPSSLPPPPLLGTHPFALWRLNSLADRELLLRCAATRLGPTAGTRSRAPSAYFWPLYRLCHAGW